MQKHFSAALPCKHQSRSSPEKKVRRTRLLPRVCFGDIIAATPFSLSQPRLSLYRRANLYHLQRGNPHNYRRAFLIIAGVTYIIFNEVARIIIVAPFSLSPRLSHSRSCNTRFVCVTRMMSPLPLYHYCCPPFIIAAVSPFSLSP